MQQAQGAIDAARAAGADAYAHTEFTAAQDALKQAREAAGQHDYQSALNHALDSRERAQNAAKEAADRKATARGDAERAMEDRSFVPDPPSAGVNGAFGIDVRNADGLIVISDLTTGFWAFKMDGFDGWNGHQWGVPNVSSAQDWDNGPEGAQKAGRVS